MHPWILLLPVAVIWTCIRVTVPNMPIEFDFDTNHGTFIMLLDKYLYCARTLVLLDLILAWVSRDGNPLAPHICVAGAVTGILFCAWITYCYERYLGARYPRTPSAPYSSYTPNKYATTAALGLASLAYTLVGIMVVLG